MNTIYLRNGKIPTWDTIHNVYYYVVIFKALQCFTIILNLGPKIITMCDRNYDIRIAYAYEIGHCLVNGYGEVGEMLVQMVRNKKIRDMIHKQLETDRLAITRELGLMHKFSPWIAVSTKTRQAVKATLNHLAHTVQELRTSGFVDDYEYTKLQDSIEDRMRVLRNLKTVELSSPKALFKELQWLQNEFVAEYLYKNSSTRVWDAGNVICENGRLSDGVFVLVTGLFKLIYKPDNEFIKYQQESGALPVVDYLASVKFNETIQDYIFAGNSIGELCVLTQRPYNCTIIAEVPSQAFVLSQRLLLNAITHDTDPIHGLACRLWKYVAINIGVTILQETIAYQSYTQDQIRLLLENSFMPNLAAYKILSRSETVHDIILIDGIIQDVANAERFVAPCYIPRTVQKMVILNNKVFQTSVKLMILPDKDACDYEVMNKLEDISELDSNASDSAVVNPLRMMAKKALPLLRRRRIDIFEQIRHIKTNIDVPDASLENLQPGAQMDLLGRIESKEESVFKPMSIHDLSYRNKQISTLTVDPLDEGFSKAKVTSGNNILVDSEMFTMDPTLRKANISAVRVTNTMRQRSEMNMQKLQQGYASSKIKQRNVKMKSNEDVDHTE